MSYKIVFYSQTPQNILVNDGSQIGQFLTDCNGGEKFLWPSDVVVVEMSCYDLIM